MLNWVVLLTQGAGPASLVGHSAAWREKCGAKGLHKRNILYISHHFSTKATELCVLGCCASTVSAGEPPTELHDASFVKVSPMSSLWAQCESPCDTWSVFPKCGRPNLSAVAVSMGSPGVAWHLHPTRILHTVLSPCRGHTPFVHMLVTQSRHGTRSGYTKHERSVASAAAMGRLKHTIESSWWNRWHYLASIRPWLSRGGIKRAEQIP